ncbi:unnamed protein product [Phytophthora fragariaefolia]|uniref:Unnamed protein product n=1 Tax=Phytophthora fragariaefolia TaxID=1490495 RepID=A0A9W6WLY0_9STRA|nr:unnamed protein product [Phytophthora fragariaefolia]
MKYKPGKQNAFADALSRRPDHELAHATTVTSSVLEKLCTSYASVNMCGTLLKALGVKEIEDLNKEVSERLRACLYGCAFDGRLLYYITGSGDPPRVVSSVSLYYWRTNLYKWASAYLRTCEACQFALYILTPYTQLDQDSGPSTTKGKTISKLEPKALQQPSLQHRTYSINYGGGEAVLRGATTSSRHKRGSHYVSTPAGPPPPVRPGSAPAATTSGQGTHVPPPAAPPATDAVPMLASLVNMFSLQQQAIATSQQQMHAFMVQQTRFQQEMYEMQARANRQKQKANTPKFHGCAEEDLELWLIHIEERFLAYTVEMSCNDSRFVDMVVPFLGVDAMAW